MTAPDPLREALERLRPPTATICKCGLAKSYHGGPLGTDPMHKYEPRYPAAAIKLGFDSAIEQARAALAAVGVPQEADPSAAPAPALDVEGIVAELVHAESQIEQGLNALKQATNTLGAITRAAYAASDTKTAEQT